MCAGATPPRVARHVLVLLVRGTNHRDEHFAHRRKDASEVATTTNQEQVMSILLTIVIGAIVGALAKLVMPGKDPGGIIITILLGIAGSFVAGMLGRAFGWYAAGEGPGIIASVLGALIVLAIYRAVLGRRPRV